MPTGKRLVTRIAASVILFALAGVAGSGQDPNQTQQPTFRTETNYVRVDVIPTANGMFVDDLHAEDFQILEDGVPQRVEQFERIVIRGNAPQEARREPETVAQSRALLEDPRARVFVLFLDTLHVDQSASRSIRRPLLDMLQRLIGPDDLVAVMTPNMSSSDVTFARRTTILEGLLERSWWGVRDSLGSADPIEENYRVCYPPVMGQGRTTSLVAQEMIDRRREKMSLEALEDLILSLRSAREERKAIITITDGWVLFRPNPGLTRQVDDRPPPLAPPINIDPRSGRLTTKDTTGNGASIQSECERDRQNLALLDDETQFQRLMDEANRANASFYPVDPRGLAVFDSPIGPDPPPPLQVDMANLRLRSESLRTIAAATDGIAVVATNQIARGLQRVVDDLSSYYLLGYYSTNTKLDGKFRSISVKTKRPGVQVRARRGYLAPTRADVRTGTARGATPQKAEVAGSATAAGVATVVGSLAGLTRDAPLRVQAASGWTSADTRGLWVVGELTGNDTATAGAVASVILVSDGAPASSARVEIAPGSRVFRAALTPTASAAGDYQIRVRVTGGGLSDSLQEIVPIALAAAPRSTGVLFGRKGSAAISKSVPTADVRFRRNERLVAELPTRASAASSARLLDRAGQPMSVPIAESDRDDADGSRWHLAEFALAPLAAGDYLLEFTTGSGAEQERSLAPFRVVR